MTSEVCLMNRLAVVLAADSASTVTRQSENGTEERYFKGANKIFQISNHNPVGIMIFDSSTILNVPWEIVVKEFRSYLKEKTFNDVKGYADEFSLFLQQHPIMFPESAQKDNFSWIAARHAMNFFAATAPEVDDDTPEIVDRLNVALTSKLEALCSAKIHSAFAAATEAETTQFVEKIIADHLDSVKSALDQATKNRHHKLQTTAMAEVGIREVITDPRGLNKTGLVFAGFGDHDIFPEMREYCSFGVVSNRHIVTEISNQKITHHASAWLSAFAQTSMSDTFSLGLSEEIYSILMKSIAEGIQSHTENVAKYFGIDSSRCTDDEIKELSESTRSKINDNLMEHVQTENVVPLRRVLGVLPIDEMAELAETLIKLQSLKEKMTKPSETVGGPIDVAVITRNEGLVWIKRKQFFDSAKNPRFLQRQAALYR